MLWKWFTLPSLPNWDTLCESLICTRLRKNLFCETLCTKEQSRRFYKDLRQMVNEPKEFLFNFLAEDLELFYKENELEKMDRLIMNTLKVNYTFDQERWQNFLQYFKRRKSNLCSGYLGATYIINDGLQGQTLKDFRFYVRRQYINTLYWLHSVE